MDPKEAMGSEPQAFLSALLTAILTHVMDAKGLGEVVGFMRHAFSISVPIDSLVNTAAFAILNLNFKLESIELASILQVWTVRFSLPLPRCSSLLPLICPLLCPLSSVSVAPRTVCMLLTLLFPWVLARRPSPAEPDQGPC